MTIKPKIGNAVNMGQLLEFEAAFPCEQPLTPQEYLKGGSKSLILNTAAFFLGFKTDNSKFADSREFLNMFFREENNGFANEVYSKIKSIEKTGEKTGIVNPYTSLKLFECFFSKTEEPETQTHAEFERNLFKAYLVLNSQFTKAQSVAFKSTEDLENNLKLSMMMFCMHYPVSDKTNYDITEILTTQVIKSIYLFQYLEANQKTQPLLYAFLAHFNSHSWQEYLKSLLPLAFSAVKNEQEAHTDIIVSKGEKFEEGCAFIEKLIVKETDELEANDFLTTRASPFYKVDEGVYRIIFNLFVVEKIFKGVYFLLRDVNNNLPQGEKISSLKGLYCYEFSEKTLVYRILEIICPKKCIRFTGQQLADKKINGAPDYYVRSGKKILLFESKDFLIRADLKASFDYSVYEEQFAKTLYYEELPNGKEKAGAVMQLIGSIKDLLRNKFLPDTDYYYKDVFIYPIIITHDHQYDTLGFGDLVNYWFQNELAILDSEGFFTHHIKPLTIINIDSLVYHQVGLTENVSLIEVIDAYHKHIKVNQKLKFQNMEESKAYILDKMITFSLFINKYFDQLEIRKLPPIIDIVAPELFRAEWEQKKSRKE